MRGKRFAASKRIGVLVRTNTNSVCGFPQQFTQFFSFDRIRRTTIKCGRYRSSHGEYCASSWLDSQYFAAIVISSVTELFRSSYRWFVVYCRLMGDASHDLYDTTSFWTV